MQWVASLSAEDIVDFREAVLMQLEQAAERTRDCGSSDAWFGDVDSVLRGVVGASNGFLFEQLIRHCAKQILNVFVKYVFIGSPMRTLRRGLAWL